MVFCLEGGGEHRIRGVFMTVGGGWNRRVTFLHFWEVMGWFTSENSCLLFISSSIYIFFYLYLLFISSIHIFYIFFLYLFISSIYIFFYLYRLLSISSIYIFWVAALLRSRGLLHFWEVMEGGSPDLRSRVFRGTPSRCRESVHFWFKGAIPVLKTTDRQKDKNRTERTANQAPPK